MHQNDHSGCTKNVLSQCWKLGQWSSSKFTMSLITDQNLAIHSRCCWNFILARISSAARFVLSSNRRFTRRQNSKEIKNWICGLLVEMLETLQQIRGISRREKLLPSEQTGNFHKFIAAPASNILMPRRLRFELLVFRSVPHTLSGEQQAGWKLKRRWWICRGECGNNNLAPAMLIWTRASQRRTRSSGSKVMPTIITIIIISRLRCGWGITP